MSDLTKISLISDESGLGETESQADDNVPDSAGPSTSGSEIPVTYIYETKWPADDQHVLGLLGRDRQAAVAVVREAFEELQGAADHRLTFHAQFEKMHPLHETPVRIMDPVWSQLVNRPPKYIRVRIKEAPKDKAEDKTNGLILASICVVVVAILIFIAIS